MNNILCRDRRCVNFLAILSAVILLSTSCKKMSDVSAGSHNNTGTTADAIVSSPGFQPILLVANDASYGALHVEPNLKNAWGMASDEGEIWVAAADANMSFVFNKSGGQLMPPVNVPGNPTGTTYNETEDFVIPGTEEPAEFIFAGEDGSISAWNDETGASAWVVATAKHASYKGLAMANDDGDNLIYATNFEKRRIDIFDKDFNQVHGRPFRDDNIPEDYSPFGIETIDNMLYVTYALRTADGEEDSTGVGLGFVDVYYPNGHFAKRFATQGTLNAPWGITRTPHVTWRADYILVGNFGDGKINAFDLDGNYLGQMQNMGTDLVVEGLWAIDAEIEGISPWQLYFTAGPNDEEDGLFGFITRNP